MGGKAYCVVHKQGLFTIDINGQMDEQDTGKLPKPSRSGNPNYDGPPIHTLTIFANPFIDDEPDIFDEGVLAIEPGEEAEPDNGGGLPPRYPPQQGGYPDQQGGYLCLLQLQVRTYDFLISCFRTGFYHCSNFFKLFESNFWN